MLVMGFPISFFLLVLKVLSTAAGVEVSVRALLPEALG